MFVIQHQHLVRLPDNAPLPPDSIAVAVPADFLTSPESYKVTGNKIVRRSEQEIRRRQRRPEILKLTQKEIARIKQAISKGKL